MKQRKNILLGILSIALLASCNGTVTEPVDTEPALSDAVPTEPQKTEPVETKPVETEPVETDPIVPESGLTDAMLDPLIDGFSGTGVFGMAVDSAYGSFQYFYSDTVAVNGDAYYFADNFEMEDPADDPTPNPDSAPLYSLYLASNASGDACSYSVTRNNELLEEVLKDGEGNPVNFAMTYSSPFGLVTADDFLEVEGEGNVFMLDPDSVVHDEFLLSASLILTGEDFSEEDVADISFYLYTDGNEITDIEFVYLDRFENITAGSNSSGMSFKAEITAVGDAVVIEAPAAVTGTPDATLEAALNALLAADRYMALAYDYVIDTTTFTASFNDGYYYEVQPTSMYYQERLVDDSGTEYVTYEGAYRELDAGLQSLIITEEGEMYQDGELITKPATIDNLLASNFEISPLFFEADPSLGGYVLKDGLPAIDFGSTSDFTWFFDITIEDMAIYVESGVPMFEFIGADTNGEYHDVQLMFQFSTDSEDYVAFEEDKIHADTTGATMSDLLTSGDETLLGLPTEVLDLIPVVPGPNPYVFAYDFSSFVGLVYYTDAASYAAYLSCFTEDAWTAGDASAVGADNYFVYNTPVTIDEASYTFSVALVDMTSIYDYFVIVPMIEEIPAETEAA